MINRRCSDVEVYLEAQGLKLKTDVTVEVDRSKSLDPLHTLDY